MKKIAVITGASSGMGRRFAETVDRYGRFDEVWVIARHQAQLEALHDERKEKTDELFGRSSGTGREDEPQRR